MQSNKVFFHMPESTKFWQKKTTQYHIFMFVVDDGFIRGNLLLKKEHKGGK